MVKLYISPSCSSCRKVREWLIENKIEFVEKNILNGSLTEEDLKEMLVKSLDGTDDIISKRSKIMIDQKVDVEEMSMKEMLNFIISNPTVLKRPIIVDDRKMQTGYDPEEIRAFIPEAMRIARRNCAQDTCETFDKCKHRLDCE